MESKMDGEAKQEPFALTATEEARREWLAYWEEIRRSIPTVEEAEHRLNVHRNSTRHLHRMTDED